MRVEYLPDLERRVAVLRYDFAVDVRSGLPHGSRHEVEGPSAHAMITAFGSATLGHKTMPHVRAHNGFFQVYVRFEFPIDVVEEEASWAEAQAEAAGYTLPTADEIARIVYAAQDEVIAKAGDARRAKEADRLAHDAVETVMDQARKACRFKQRLAAIEAEVQAEYDELMADFDLTGSCDPAIDAGVVALAAAHVGLYKDTVSPVPKPLRHRSQLLDSGHARPFRPPTP